MYYVVGKNNCPWCVKAKEELERDNTPYVYKNLDTVTEVKRQQWVDFIKNELSMKTVPVVFKLVGGFIELEDERRNTNT